MTKLFLSDYGGVPVKRFVKRLLLWGLGACLALACSACGGTSLQAPLALSGTESLQNEPAGGSQPLSELSWEPSKAADYSEPSEEESKMTIQIGDTALTAVLADNDAARALLALLEEGPLTIEMEDYGSMEKVGNIGASLPRCDEQITTQAGDLILYQGKSFVIYYAPNTWNFTRLGRIDGVTGEELLALLGDGDVTVTLMLA